MKNEERWVKSQISIEIVPHDKANTEDDKKANEFIKELTDKVEGNNLLSPLVFSSVTEDDYTRFLDALEKEGTISPVIENEFIQREYAREQEGVVGFAFLYEGHVIIRAVRDKYIYVHLCLNKDIDEQAIIKYINKFWDAKESNVVTVHDFFSKELRMETKQYKFPKLRIV